jgi:hypothetical protein
MRFWRWLIYYYYSVLLFITIVLSLSIIGKVYWYRKMKKQAIVLWIQV